MNYGDSCPVGKWTCLDGTCIDTSNICNGTNDCSDGGDEDETICGSSDACSSGEIVCDGACITASVMCDGVNDCLDAGKHIFVEKPLATNSSDVKKLFQKFIVY